MVIGHFLLPVATTRFTTNSLYLIYTFHMPCFIFVSGYLAKGVYREGRFRWDRLASGVAGHILVELGVHVTEGMLAGYIGWRVDFFHESGAPWYLLALIFWYLLISVFYYMKKWLSLALVLLVGLAGGYAGSLGDFLAADRVLAFAPFFYLGYFFTAENLRKLCSGKMRIAAVGAGAAVAAVIFLGTYDYLEPYRLAVYGAMYDRVCAGALFRLLADPADLLSGRGGAVLRADSLSAVRKTALSHPVGSADPVCVCAASADPGSVPVF